MNIWRQGDVVSPVHAVALGLISPEQSATHRLVVASHSCDIATQEQLEPEVELLIAVVVPAERASCSNGHSIRKLHLPTQALEGTEWLEFGISNRQLVKKASLQCERSWNQREIKHHELGILRRWLAQRYTRSAFPNSFVTWLQESGVDHRLERIAKKYSSSLSSIYFDLEDESERPDPDTPYELGIYLVHRTVDSGHAALAREAAAELQNIFEARCFQQQHWRWVELLYCEAISDKSFTLHAANEFRRWRLEHRSIAGEPIDEPE